MLAAPLLVTTLASTDTGNLSDSASVVSNPDSVFGHSRKFPHTRAQLSAIAREYKPVDSSGTESDVETEFSGRVSSVLVKQVVALLDDEKEDELKVLLKGTFGMDDDAAEPHVLDLMHKHKDDTAGVPFLFLTPTRRPISRPSSRASTNSFRLNRPETPASAPGSPSLLGPRRPHTPMMSPLGTPQNSSGYLGYSPGSSPILAYAPIPANIAHVHHSHFATATSLPASPLGSPRLLNAKAMEFRPLPRPLSAASSNPGSFSIHRDQTPSPDLWAHGSGKGGMSRLAIASPILPDRSLSPRALTPNSSLRASLLPDDEDVDEPEDPYDSFDDKVSHSFDPAMTYPAEFETQLSNSSNSASSFSEDYPSNLHPWSQEPYYGESEYDVPMGPWAYGDQLQHHQLHPQSEEIDAEAAEVLTDGMTPFDVLSSVFGATLAPSELEEALVNNGYDFERTMQWLVDRTIPQPQPYAVNQPRMGGGAGVQIVPRSQAGFVRGARAGYSNAQQRGAPRYVNGRPPPGGNRVCRYFLAGECMRADCRFSHDLERALCRFWLRGTCAKGEACEFLHHLPDNVDMAKLTIAMNHTNLGPDPSGSNEAVMQEDFPTLGYDNGRGRHGGFGSVGYSRDRQYNDPGRTRFAAAVKKPIPMQDVMLVNKPPNRTQMAVVGDSVYHRPTVVAPRPSPRIKLRPPSLLPTLATGEAVNKLYMAYRARSLQLGAARNACLSRAADAWRRGDGAAAKRFSREGHDLNVKMSAEANDAANNLVRERAKLAETSVRNRDSYWSDDPGDRASRGKACGGGLGVCLGIASKDQVGNDGATLTPEERTEAALDLHGLHSNEAAEVLESFLLTLEREHFFGLAYIIVGEEKHTGSQDPARGASRARLATGIREWLHNWGYPWSDRDGVICVDPLTHMQ